MQQLTVRGILLVDGQPSSDQQLLLISQNKDLLLAVATTDSDGQFEFSLAAQDDSKAIVLAKITGGYVGPVYREIDLPHAAPLEIDIDTGSSFNLAMTVESSAGYPEHLDVFLDAIVVAGVPEQLQRFFKQVDRGVFSSHFLELPIDDKAFSFKVGAGTYRIGAHYIIEDRPLMDNPAFNNFITETAVLVPDGKQLAGDSYGGFVVTVDKDVNVVLSLRVLEDEELFGRDNE